LHRLPFTASSARFRQHALADRLLEHTVATMAPIHLYMPDGGEAGIIQAWFAGSRKWVEFRGAPYSRWDGENGGAFQAVHDALEGWHATVLHTDQRLDLLDTHPDYLRVRAMMG
jgi:hypothetical protein